MHTYKTTFGASGYQIICSIQILEWISKNKKEKETAFVTFENENFSILDEKKSIKEEQK